MYIYKEKSEREMQVLYEQRIDGLGKCLLLWASLCSELGSSDPWHYTEPNADHLMHLIDEMACFSSR